MPQRAGTSWMDPLGVPHALVRWETTLNLHRMTPLKRGTVIRSRNVLVLTGGHACFSADFMLSPALAQYAQ